MIVRKPMILYYDNGQKEKSRSMKRALEHMGITFVPITGAHFLQTVGHLAKVKGFPARKIPVIHRSFAIRRILTTVR